MLSVLVSSVFSVAAKILSTCILWGWGLFQPSWKVLLLTWAVKTLTFSFKASPSTAIAVASVQDGTLFSLVLSWQPCNRGLLHNWILVWGTISSTPMAKQRKQRETLDLFVLHRNSEMASSVGRNKSLLLLKCECVICIRCHPPWMKGMFGTIAHSTTLPLRWQRWQAIR